MQIWVGYADGGVNGTRCGGLHTAPSVDYAPIVVRCDTDAVGSHVTLRLPGAMRVGGSYPGLAMLAYPHKGDRTLDSLLA